LPRFEEVQEYLLQHFLRRGPITEHSQQEVEQGLPVLAIQVPQDPVPRLFAVVVVHSVNPSGLGPHENDPFSSTVRRIPVYSGRYRKTFSAGERGCRIVAGRKKRTARPPAASGQKGV